MKWSVFVLSLSMSVFTFLSCAHSTSYVSNHFISEDAGEDPYLWLEEVESEEAIGWVKQKNENSLGILQSDPLYETIEKEMAAIILAEDRLATPFFIGDQVYNFWQDKVHVRGILRKTTLSSYKTNRPRWETVIDLDQLAKSEKSNWVWRGISCYELNTKYCLVRLSDGGKDAITVREFDLEAKSFVENGFYLPEGKHRANWLNPKTLLLGYALGEENLTESGYANSARLWKRGENPENARVLLRGERSDVSVWAFTDRQGDELIPFVGVSKDFFNSDFYFLRTSDDAKNTAEKMSIPRRFRYQGLHQDRIILSINEGWKLGRKSFPQGALLALPLTGEPGSRSWDGKSVEVLFEPGPRESLSSVTAGRETLFVLVLNNISSELFSYKFKDGQWSSEKMALPELGALRFVTYSQETQDLLIQYQSHLTPMSYYWTNESSLKNISMIKSLPARFNSEAFEVSQKEVKSRDGTKIPYFLIKDKNTKMNGKNPTVLYGYGGFQVSLGPHYSGAVGKSWLERGGVYVVANIRGGGEFGPAWHEAALKENRQKAFDDFIAVAEDLIASQITSPDHLGISGGSNGGLLVGAVMTQRPELFRAVSCSVPLLDMLRYHLLLAGASWVGEYGDPEDPKMREVILRYSPYQNLKPDVEYPSVFFSTSTKDDRVHPGHARKMAARMEEYGHNFLYFENIDGGHGGAANLNEAVVRNALIWTYFNQELR